MDQVEVVMTGYSIIVAMCVARLLDGLRPSSAATRRYWVHLTWVINKIINVLVIYWATWYFADAEINFAQFLLILAPPAIVYLQCDALLTKRPDDVVSWSDHYYANHRYFFGANLLLGLTLLAQIHWASSGGYPIAATYLLVMLCVASMIAALSSHRIVHAVVAVLGFVNLTAGFVAELTRLG